MDADEGREYLLTSEELHHVSRSEKDPLVQQFLTLAYVVLALPTTEDATAEREVREAISALGLAVEALPPEQKVVTDDPTALRAEAETQAAEAQAETDAVIAASLRRRVESLTRRAETAARTLLLLRRNQALQEEVGEQIQALQTSLTALQVGGRQSVPELAGLAASIQRVAQEANAMTAARAEVGMMVAEPQVRVTRPSAEETRAVNRR